MRVKYLMPFLVLILVFGFGLASCNNDSNEINNEIEDKIFESLVDKNLEIKNLKSELKDIKNQLKIANEEIDKLKLEKPEEKTEEENETFSSWEEKSEAIRKIIEEIIEDVFYGELTKFKYEEEGSPITIGYNTRWSSENRVKKQLFDISKFFSGTEMIQDYYISATTDSGKTYNSHTTIENILKLKNFELSYEEWLKEAF